MGQGAHSMPILFLASCREQLFVRKEKWESVLQISQ